MITLGHLPRDIEVPPITLGSRPKNIVVPLIIYQSLLCSHHSGMPRAQTTPYPASRRMPRIHNHTCYPCCAHIASGCQEHRQPYTLHHTGCQGFTPNQNLASTLPIGSSSLTHTAKVPWVTVTYANTVVLPSLQDATGTQKHIQPCHACISLGCHEHRRPHTLHHTRCQWSTKTWQ